MYSDPSDLRPYDFIEPDRTSTEICNVPRLNGKTCLIAGGAGGIGVEAARRMTAEGARVVIADRMTVAPDHIMALEFDYVSLDVTSDASWRDAVAVTDARCGGIDVLVNAAGIEGDQSANSIATTSLAEWRRVHAVNLDGTFLGCQSVLPVMERTGRGSIINVASVATYFPMPFNCAYGASKAAVQHLTKSVAAWGTRSGHRIRCNSVHPGLVRTRMLSSIVGSRLAAADAQVDDAIARQAHASIPLRDASDPEDVAHLIVYLAADESRHVTGAEFRVDGGWSIAAGGWTKRLGPEAETTQQQETRT